MTRSMRRWLQILMKFANSATGILGFASIIYGVWMMIVWQKYAAASSDVDHTTHHLPLFIHAFVCFGIVSCAISFLGHFAATTANSCCISCYTALMFLLLLFETALVANISIHSGLEKYQPVYSSRRFEDFKDFVKSKIAIGEWIALYLALAQGCSIILAIVLNTLGQYEGNSLIQRIVDEESHDQPQRFPLLNQPADHMFPFYVPNPPVAIYNWS